MKSEDYRREYNKMVTEINNQLRRLEKADPESVSLERYRNYFQKVTTKNPNYRTIQKLYSSAKRLLRSNELSVEWQDRSKAAAIRTLQDEGMTYINRKNFSSYMRFLDDARARGLASMYSSTQIIEAVHEARQQGLTKDQIMANIDRWAKNIRYDREGKVIEQIEPKRLKVKI